MEKRLVTGIAAGALFIGSAGVSILSGPVAAADPSAAPAASAAASSSAAHQLPKAFIPRT